MSAARRVSAVAAALALGAVGPVACGGISEKTVVVRIGGTAITKATVDHWVAVIERKGAFAGFRGEPHGTARQRALALLISSEWLTGEAALMGVPVPEYAVEEAIAESERAGPAFRRHLRATGQTLADVKLEARAELAGESIREALAERAGRFTQREVADYYRKHVALFGRPYAKVRAQVARTLDVERQRALATRFDGEYRAKWGAITTCRSGYVAPGCPQDHALLGAYEDPFSLRAHPVLAEQGASG